MFGRVPGTRVLISLWDSLMFGRVPGTRVLISLWVRAGDDTASDDAASTMPAFRVLKVLVERWYKGAQNQWANELLCNFYRWLRSPSSMLYDPTLFRMVRDRRLHFVPGSPHVIRIELRQALISYQDDHVFTNIVVTGAPHGAQGLHAASRRVPAPGRHHRLRLLQQGHHLHRQVQPPPRTRITTCVL